MAPQRNPAYDLLPPPNLDDPRFLDLRTEDTASADLLLVGCPFDDAVLGRKGAAGGPAGIREAFRYLGTWDVDRGIDLRHLRWCDVGDVEAPRGPDILALHDAVQKEVGTVLAQGKPTVILGGDHGLTYAHMAALAETTQAGPASMGLVVVDAHYDMRPWKNQPTSGTPFRRILDELPGQPVAGRNLVEVGIRPYANTASLSQYAADHGVKIISARQVADRASGAVADEALHVAGHGTTHLWLSICIDGLDQATASGSSAPGAGGLSFWDVEALVHRVASDPRCRGMDILETAPELDPTGNTCRVAAQLVAAFAGAVAARN